MIRYFRKIRKKLLIENRLVKYLIYAIGEIILVVIGILIALNFNNQNESHKDLKNEIEMLMNLKRDLNKNLIELNGTYDLTNHRYQSSVKALSYIEENKQLDDSFKVALELLNHYDMNNIWSTTYKYIENQGATSMHNNNLRLKITEMYDRHFYNVTYRENLDLKRVDQFLKPELYKLLQMWQSSIAIDSVNKSNQSDQLLYARHMKNATGLWNFISDHGKFLDARMFRQEETLEELKKLIDEIDVEIERLKQFE